MNATEIDIIQSAYAALNNYDIPGFLALLSPDVVRFEHFTSPPFTCRGIEEMRAHLEKGRSSWAEGSCTPEKFTIHGNRIVVSAYVHVRVNNETEWRNGYTGDVFTFKDGRIVEFSTFGNHNDALAYAVSDVF